MAAWSIPLQTAAYRGVTFEVLTLDESNRKALVQHDYPYVDGADIEDMGLDAHEVHLTAIYNGPGFDTRIKRLVTALAERGAAVLVHPVMGRMPDMIVSDYSVHYNAENVNYVEFDLTFRKSTTGNPIFVTGDSLIAEIDRLALMIDALIQQYFGRFVALLGDLLGAFGQILAISDVLTALITQISTSYDLNLTAPSMIDTLPKQRGKAVILTIDTLITAPVKRAQSRDDILVQRMQLDAIIDTIKQLLRVKMSDASYNTRSALTEQSVDLIVASAHVSAAFAVAQIAADKIDTVIDDHDDTSDGALTNHQQMTPIDIERIDSTVRHTIQLAIDVLHSIEQQHTQSSASATSVPPDAIYQQQEDLRQLAAAMHQLTRNAINQKPPLIVKPAEFDGTIHQFAHAFYSDWRRADELLALNPHITHPAFITRGTLINAYAQ